MIRHIFHRDGLALIWQDSGGNGLPVVFQHGLCGDAGQTFGMFPDAAYRLITLECRGHGGSEFGTPSIAIFADDLVALIESLALGPVVLGGISMGAAIAARIAVLRPDLVRALVMVRPAWGVAPAPENLQRNLEVGGFLAQFSAEQALAKFQQGATFQALKTGSPDNLASLIGFFSRHPKAVTAALLTTISADGPGITAAQLAGLTCPALICGTEADVIHPLALAEQLAGLIPNAQFVRLASKGTSKAAHIADFQAAFAALLKEL